MSRQYAKGFYDKSAKELSYIIRDRKGKVLYRLKNGSEITFSNIVYRVFERNGKLFVRRNSKKLSTGFYEQELIDKLEMALSTNSQSAYVCFYKKYKHVKVNDELSKFLVSIGFILQCMKILPSLEGIDLKVKSGYDKRCSMYTDDKNWYTYAWYTDAQIVDKLKIVSSSCAGCKAKLSKLGIKCEAENSSLHFGLKGGSYYFLISTDVKTGKKRLNELIITKEAERGNVLQKIKQALEC